MPQLSNILDFRTKTDKDGNTTQDFSSQIDSPKVINKSHYELQGQIIFDINKEEAHAKVRFYDEIDGEVYDEEVRTFIFTQGLSGASPQAIENKVSQLISQAETSNTAHAPKA